MVPAVHPLRSRLRHLFETLLCSWLLTRCCCAVQEEVDKIYQDQDEWTRRSILYTAGSGFFSSDRTIKQYADEIWDVKPVPVPSS